MGWFNRRWLHRVTSTPLQHSLRLRLYWVNFDTGQLGSTARQLKDGPGQSI